MTQISADKNDPETYAVIGTGMEVHTLLGHGFLEAVYQEAMAIELARRNISYQREVPLDIHYKGIKLSTPYRADFVCFGSMVLEIKAISTIGNIEHAQLLNYLKATGFKRGLLLNFGSPKLQCKRMVNGFDPASARDKPIIHR